MKNILVILVAIFITSCVFDKKIIGYSYQEPIPNSLEVMFDKHFNKNPNIGTNQLVRQDAMKKFEIALKDSISRPNFLSEIPFKVENMIKVGKNDYALHLTHRGFGSYNMFDFLYKFNFYCDAVTIVPDSIAYSIDQTKSYLIYGVTLPTSPRKFSALLNNTRPYVWSDTIEVEESTRFSENYQHYDIKLGLVVMFADSIHVFTERKEKTIFVPKDSINNIPALRNTNLNLK